MLISIPSRLAITDWPGQGGPASAPLPPAAHWSRVLASRVVVLIQDGAANPHAPYLDVLPEACPTPWLIAGDSACDSVRHGPAATEIDRLRSVAVQWERDSGGDSGLARWALSVRSEGPGTKGGCLFGEVLGGGT